MSDAFGKKKKKKEFPERNRYLRGPTHSRSPRALRGFWLSLGTGGCPHREMVLSSLKGGFHDHRITESQAHRLTESQNQRIPESQTHRLTE